MSGEQAAVAEVWDPDAHQARLDKYGSTLDRWNVNYVAARIADYPELIRAVAALATAALATATPARLSDEVEAILNDDAIEDFELSEKDWAVIGECNCAHCEDGDGICPMRVQAMIWQHLTDLRDRILAARADQPTPLPPHQDYDEPCGHVERYAAVTTHTRTSTEGHGPDYCAECSEAVSEWVQWPCPRAVQPTPPAVVGDDEYGISADAETGAVKVYAPGEDMTDPSAGKPYPPPPPPSVQAEAVAALDEADRVRAAVETWARRWIGEKWDTAPDAPKIKELRAALAPTPDGDS